MSRVFTNIGGPNSSWVSTKTDARRRSDLWSSPFSARSIVARRLTPARKAWISKLRHGEHQWQRRKSSNRPVASTTVDSYAARRSRTQSLTAVREALCNAGIELVELPRLGAATRSKTRVTRSTSLATWVVFGPRMRSPSQWSASVRSLASWGRSAMGRAFLTVGRYWPRMVSCLPCRRDRRRRRVW